MIGRNPDTLPQSPAVSALVRRIAFKLDGALRFAGHAALSHEERASLFMLGDASTTLDRIATLPRMADHEERARRDLLELYDIFDPPAPASSIDDLRAVLAPTVKLWGEHIDAALATRDRVQP